MKEFCENERCANRGFKEVPVSVRKAGDEKRTFCAACEEAWSIGVQHGTFTALAEPIWLLAVADRGVIVHIQPFASEEAAEEGLDAYLRKEQGYPGPRHPDALRRWLRMKEDRLSVQITSLLHPSRLS